MDELIPVEWEGQQIKIVWTTSGENEESTSNIMLLSRHPHGIRCRNSKGKEFVYLNHAFEVVCLAD